MPKHVLLSADQQLLPGFCVLSGSAQFLLNFRCTFSCIAAMTRLTTAAEALQWHYDDMVDLPSVVEISGFTGQWWTPEQYNSANMSFFSHIWNVRQGMTWPLMLHFPSRLIFGCLIHHIHEMTVVLLFGSKRGRPYHVHAAWEQYPASSTHSQHGFTIWRLRIAASRDYLKLQLQHDPFFPPLTHLVNKTILTLFCYTISSAECHIFQAPITFIYFCWLVLFRR